MTMIRTSDVLAGLFAAVPMLAGNALHAQSVGANTNDTAGVVLEEITVTAQKRSENLQEVPIAITAFSAEQLEAMGITTLGGIGTATPGLSISSIFNDSMPSFSLRGVSALDYNQNQSSPVAMYTDEVYKGVSILTALQMYDVERVEVLHGPQGTLFGKNTTGGAVSVYTRKPDLDDGFTGQLRAGLGNYDRREASGAANIPMIDGVLAGRVAFTYTEVDGYIKNRLAGVKDQASVDDHAVRVSLAWQPSESASFVLRLADARSAGTSPGVFPDDIGIGGPGGAGFGTGYTREGLGFFDNESQTAGRLIVENSSVSLTGSWELPAATITSISSYDSGEFSMSCDCDGTPFDILSETLTNDVESYAQDLRIASNDDGPLTWLVGAYYYHDRVSPTTKFQFFYEFAGDADGNGQLDCFDNPFMCGYDNAFRQVRRSVALYTHESYAITDRFTLTAGLRYTDDVNELESYQGFSYYYDPALGQEVRKAQTIAAPPIDRSKNDNVGGKLGIDVKLTPEVLLYASIGRGFRGAAFNGAALFGPDEITSAPPERLDAVEIGAKSQWLQDRLRLNAAVFHYDYLNQQFLDVTPAGLQVLTSIPRSRIVGAELELSAKPVERLGLRLGASYLDAEYREGNVQGVDVAGNVLNMSPEWTLNGSLDWTLYEGSALAVTLHGDSRYSSRQFFNAFNTPTLAQDAFWLHNARLTFEMSALSVTAWVTNLANEEYVAYNDNTAALFNFNFSNGGKPRQYGIEAVYRF